jgi:hypothetical protein
LAMRRVSQETPPKCVWAERWIGSVKVSWPKVWPAPRWDWQPRLVEGLLRPPPPRSYPDFILYQRWPPYPGQAADPGAKAAL